VEVKSEYSNEIIANNGAQALSSTEDSAPIPTKDGRKVVIDIKDIFKKYDVTAVDGLTIKVMEGELFGLLGPNGAGKTTLINMLCGLTKPTAGSAEVAGYDIVNEITKVKDKIGVCPQETALFLYLTGRENLELFGSLYMMPKDVLKRRSQELLAGVGLLEDANRRVGKYSGGMKKRLSLICALVQEPEIAFLDEPTVAMDPQSRHAVWDFIRDLAKDGKTVILTTHYMEEAQELCDRVGIIDHGKLIALGTPVELMEKYSARQLEDVFLQLTGRNIREGL
jgi:ABC-2 type transport system ATP-binding protein